MTNKHYWELLKKVCKMSLNTCSACCNKSIGFLAVYKKFTHHWSDQDNRLESTYLECQSVWHHFFSSDFSSLDSHLYKNWSTISLALGFGYTTVSTHLESCEFQPLVLVRSSSMFSAHLHFAQV